MTMEVSLWDLLYSILALPVQLMRHVIWAGLDFLAFDVLGLGPYLPITL